MAEHHLTLLLEMLGLLERYRRTISRADMDTDREAWLKVKAALEVSAQCAIDLAMELVARRRLGSPQTYRETFGMLARAGILEAGLARELEGWAGLRNVLVHLYTTLDLDRVHAALGETAALRSFHALAARELLHHRP
ncbi:MAG: DUF86 domain-containing protein [Planctomycetes bacterium]|nr:DUF86 domain-containing protein [Planctomycetota bacterium]